MLETRSSWIIPWKFQQELISKLEFYIQLSYESRMEENTSNARSKSIYLSSISSQEHIDKYVSPE